MINQQQEIRKEDKRSEPKFKAAATLPINGRKCGNKVAKRGGGNHHDGWRRRWWHRWQVVTLSCWAHVAYLSLIWHKSVLSPTWLIPFIFISQLTCNELLIDSLIATSINRAGHGQQSSTFDAQIWLNLQQRSSQWEYTPIDHQILLVKPIHFIIQSAENHQPSCNYYR